MLLYPYVHHSTPRKSLMQIKRQHNNSEVYKSTTELTRLMNEVLELAKKEGATDAASQ